MNRLETDKILGNKNYYINPTTTGKSHLGNVTSTPANTQKVESATLPLFNSPYANRATFGLKRKLSRSSSLERPNI